MLYIFTEKSFWLGVRVKKRIFKIPLEYTGFGKAYKKYGDSVIGGEKKYTAWK